MKQRLFFIFTVVFSLFVSTTAGITAKDLQDAIETNEEVYSEVAETKALGVAGNFNLFVLDDVDMNSTDTEGRMAVGGNMDVSGFGVGDKVNRSTTRYDLIVGKNATIRATENKSGNTLIDNESEYHFDAYGHLNGVDNPFRMNTRTFFENTKQELYRLTKKHSEYEGIIQGVVQYSSLELTGTNPDYNVFEVKAEDLAQVIETKIKVPYNSTVIINVVGETVTFPTGTVFYNGSSGEGSLPYAETVLWNMPQAKQITTKSSGVFGSVLAPYAHVDSIQGQINGNLIVKSLSGHIESHLHLFRPRVMPPAPKKEYVSLTVNKTWVDDNNINELRPSEITVRLIANGNRERILATAALSEKNSWKTIFILLPKYDEQDQEIVYTIVEDEVEHYESAIEINGNHVTITNTYTPEEPELMSININKEWADDNNREGLRPTEIIVSLIKDKDIKNPVGTYKITPNESGEWNLTINNLPKFEDGVKINYDIIESKVTGYILSSMTKSNDEFRLINRRDTQYRSIQVEKQWSDDNASEGLRPDSIRVSLIANDDFDNPVEIKTITPDHNGQWKIVFENLPVYEDGEEIIYTVREHDVEQYESTVSGNMVKGFVIRNSRDVELKDLMVTKVWVENENTIKTRGNSITVELYADGELLETREISEAMNWTTTFEDLQVYRDGKKVNYHIKELPVLGYTSVVELIDEHNIVIKNTEEPDAPITPLEPKKPVIPKEPETPGTPKEPITPKTSINNFTYMWITIIGISVLGIVTIKRVREK